MNSEAQTGRPLASHPTPPLRARGLLLLLERMVCGHLTLRTPEGDTMVFGDMHQAPGAELIMHDWRACQAILWHGDIGFAEAYRDGLVDTPDLTALFHLALANERVLEKALFGGALSRLWHRLVHLLRSNTRRGSRRNIPAHYDIGNRFYGLWLDSTWSYSSALFEGDYHRDLVSAQQAKYQRILDALALPPGAHILEIGCGWGGFAELATTQGYRVSGITLSQEQLAHARARLAHTPLADFTLCDYRDITGQYDAVVSIEMIEAVGERYWPTYLARVRDALRLGGKAALQSIVIDDARFERYRSGSDFIQRFIFPGGMLPSLPRLVQEAARHSLSVLDSHAFGADYAETLRRWHQSFLQQLDAVRAQGFDDGFIRLWRTYLAYCEAGFDSGRTDVVQVLFEKT